MGLWEDIMGSGMDTSFRKYTERKHLSPKERIRSFLVEEKISGRIKDDATNWMCTAVDIFRFARDHDSTGELEMYAAAACFRASFMPVGTAWLRYRSRDEGWRLGSLFFMESIRRAPDRMDGYFGRSGLKYYPGFPQRHDPPEQLEPAMQGTQLLIKFRRFHHPALGYILYFPLYDDETLIFSPKPPLDMNEWESQII